MMKVIFLDIDGVLNTYDDDDHDYLVGNPHKCSPTLVKRLDRLILATGAKIVVSSTWRDFHSIDWVEGFLIAHGLTLNESDTFGRERLIVGQTPKKFSSVRGQEIGFYLDDFEVENFVILDDDDSAMSLHEGHFVKINDKIGLQDSDVDAAIEILRKS